MTYESKHGPWHFRNRRNDYDAYIQGENERLREEARAHDAAIPKSTTEDARMTLGLRDIRKMMERKNG